MLLGEIFGPDLLVVVVVLAVLLFGGAAIPKFAKNLGSAKSEFENGLKAAPSRSRPRLTLPSRRSRLPGPSNRSSSVTSRKLS
jgi:Sec-independent protein translocase protein TatA